MYNYQSFAIQQDLKRNRVMKSTFRVVLVLLVGVAIGFVVGGGSIDRAAKGQVAKEPPRAYAAPRYQLAAGNKSFTVLDTITGELWHSLNGDAPYKIADELPKLISDDANSK
jgi:hypothetical protein